MFTFCFVKPSAFSMSCQFFSLSSLRKVKLLKTLKLLNRTGKENEMCVAFVLWSGRRTHHSGTVCCWLANIWEVLYQTDKLVSQRVTRSLQVVKTDMREDEERGMKWELAWNVQGRRLAYRQILRKDWAWVETSVCVVGPGRPADVTLDMPALAEIPRTDRKHRCTGNFSVNHVRCCESASFVMCLWYPVCITESQGVWQHY